MATAKKPSRLQQLLERPVDRAPIGTITGEAGVGKTTLGSLFPKPVFLRFEDGVESIPEARRPFSFPLARSHAEAMEYVETLATDEHGFQTLVVDSVTKAASIFEAEIIEADPRKPKSINQAFGGYGAGLNAAGEKHRLFYDACQVLNQSRGMAIIFIAHSTIETVEPPDADPYTRYTLRLDKRPMAHYIDGADFVAFVRVNVKYLSKEDQDRKRAIADKKRIIVLHPTGAHVSKNRYGIESPVEWADPTMNPLLPLIPYYKGLAVRPSTKK